MTNQIASKEAQTRWATKDTTLLGHVKTMLEGVAAPDRLRNAPAKLPYWQAD